MNSTAHSMSCGFHTLDSVELEGLCSKIYDTKILFEIHTQFVYPNSVFLIHFALPFAQSTSQGCLKNFELCQPDNSLGSCCSAYCYKQVGWVTGYCR